MSVHDETDLTEIEVRIALERELSGIVPRPAVAAAVISRYRRERRRKRAGLAVAVAGIGVPLAVVPLTMAAGGPGEPAGPVLQIAAYTLQLPASYRELPCGSRAGSGQAGRAGSVSPASVSPGSVSPAGVSGASVSAVSSAGGCIVLALAPASATRAGRDAGVGRYRVRLVPDGMVVAPPAPGAPALTVSSTSVPVPDLERLVAGGLRYAA